jgi:hypothetical protein
VSKGQVFLLGEGTTIRRNLMNIPEDPNFQLHGCQKLKLAST